MEQEPISLESLIDMFWNNSLMKRGIFHKDAVKVVLNCLLREEKRREEKRREEKRREEKRREEKRREEGTQHAAKLQLSVRMRSPA